MRVCMYVLMYTYVCMYVCMYGGWCRNIVSEIVCSRFLLRVYALLCLVFGWIHVCTHIYRHTLTRSKSVTSSDSEQMRIELELTVMLLDLHTMHSYMRAHTHTHTYTHRTKVVQAQTQNKCAWSSNSRSCCLTCMQWARKGVSTASWNSRKRSTSAMKRFRNTVPRWRSTLRWVGTLLLQWAGMLLLRDYAAMSGHAAAAWVCCDEWACCCCVSMLRWAGMLLLPEYAAMSGQAAAAACWKDRT